MGSKCIPGGFQLGSVGFQLGSRCVPGRFQVYSQWVLVGFWVIFGGFPGRFLVVSG